MLCYCIYVLNDKSNCQTEYFSTFFVKNYFHIPMETYNFAT